MGFTPEQSARFEKLYHAVAKASADSKIVQLVDNMLDLLVEGGEAQVKNIGVKNVVPHSANRSGALMEARKIYSKGSKIIGVGFSMNRCDPKRAVAFQTKPGDCQHVEAFIRHANGSPHLATFEASTIEACSVGCGHLSQFLACIKDEVEVPAEFIDDQDLFGGVAGRKLDSHALCKSQDQQLRTALDKGVLLLCCFR